MSRYGFFFLMDVFSNTKYKSKFTYNLKKLIYSFSYKNEIQKYILKRYIKNNFINNFYNTNRTLVNNKFIKSTHHFYNDNNLFFFDSFMKKTNECLFIFNQNLFNSNN